MALFGRKSRGEKRGEKLGIIQLSSDLGHNKYAKCRKDILDTYDKYYEGTQYDHLIAWDSVDCSEQYIGIRKRKPRIIYNVAKKVVSTFATRMLGQSTFPKITCPDDETANQALQEVIVDSKFENVSPELMRRMGLSGSALLRFFFNDEDELIYEIYNAKYCYPELAQNGDLLACRIRYVFDDVKDLDPQGRPKKKWYQLDLGLDIDILYDNPEYKEGAEPMFSVINEISHNLGFVQAEWFRTIEKHDDVDGESLLAGGVLSMIDDINYSLSQSSQAIAYGQEPQVTLSGMDEEDIDCMVKSSSKAWNLGREGKAEFLEAGLSGVESADSMRGKLRHYVSDVTRVILQDPDKMGVGQQSGRALEILNQPTVDLITEMRPNVQKRMTSMYRKMLDMYGTREGFFKESGLNAIIKQLNMLFDWPPVFEKTMEDLKAKVGVAVQASNGNIISRASATRWVAKDFNIEDVEAEIAAVENQKVLNPFGGF